jgi:flagellar hook-basal body complex protein FliE
MTSPISGVSGLSALSGLSGVSGLSGSDGVSGVSGTDGSGIGTTGTTGTQGPNGDFAGMLAQGLQNVQASQKKADDLAVQAADGTLKDPAQYTMAANEASLGLDLTLAVRNKALDAFQEIMRMQA